jgi:predicted ATPase
MHIRRIQIHADRFPTRDRYPFGLACLQQTGALALDAPITLFVGENGSGKSTLLRAVTRRTGIHIWADPDAPRVERNPYEQHLWHYIATHSPILLSCPGARIFSFDRAPIQPVAYKETDHYRVYRDFMADPRGYTTEGKQGP